MFVYQHYHSIYKHFESHISHLQYDNLENSSILFCFQTTARSSSRNGRFNCTNMDIFVLYCVLIWYTIKRYRQALPSAHTSILCSNIAYKCYGLCDGMYNTI